MSCPHCCEGEITPGIVNNHLCMKHRVTGKCCLQQKLELVTDAQGEQAADSSKNEGFNPSCSLQIKPPELMSIL